MMYERKRKWKRQKEIRDDFAINTGQEVRESDKSKHDLQGQRW